jgi:hypothetical protein
MTEQLSSQLFGSSTLPQEDSRLSSSCCPMEKFCNASVLNLKDETFSSSLVNNHPVNNVKKIEGIPPGTSFSGVHSVDLVSIGASVRADEVNSGTQRVNDFLKDILEKDLKNDLVNKSSLYTDKSINKGVNTNKCDINDRVFYSKAYLNYCNNLVDDNYFVEDGNREERMFFVDEDNSYADINDGYRHKKWRKKEFPSLSEAYGHYSKNFHNYSGANDREALNYKYFKDNNPYGVLENLEEMDATEHYDSPVFPTDSNNGCNVPYKSNDNNVWFSKNLKYFNDPYKANFNRCKNNALILNNEEGASSNYCFLIFNNIIDWKKFFSILDMHNDVISSLSIQEEENNVVIFMLATNFWSFN